MSRSTLLIAGLALILGAGALVLQFVGPSGEGDDGAALAELQSQVAALQNQGAGQELRIAYMNAEDAFTVFTDAVADLRQRAEEKKAEAEALAVSFQEGTVSPEDYNKQLAVLQVELLDAQWTIDMGTINKMLASDGFADMRADLEKLKDDVQTYIDDTKNLISTARVGILNEAEFQAIYSRATAAFNQFDQLLTKAASTKLVAEAERIAIENGYDLVIRVKNVIMYRNPATLDDITDLVKSRISSYFN